MKVILENENKKNNNLKIFYITIIAICIISIVVGIFIQIRDKDKNIISKLPKISEEQLNNYKNQFNDIFKNKVNYLENNSYKITKIQQDKEIVYTGYKDNSNQVNDYELDINIPYINIKNETTEQFNKQIKDIFEQKAKSVLNSQGNNVIYTVNYSAYVTNNILSLVIRSTLKEGNNPQRDIIQAYNYDLIEQNQCTVQKILELKGITTQEADKKIKVYVK